MQDHSGFMDCAIHSILEHSKESKQEAVTSVS